jgi:hypothetical protein
MAFGKAEEFAAFRGFSFGWRKKDNFTENVLEQKKVGERNSKKSLSFFLSLSLSLSFLLYFFLPLLKHRFLFASQSSADMRKNETFFVNLFFVSLKSSKYH